MLAVCLRIGLRNTLRHLRRNTATGLAVACGFAALTLVAGYMVRVNSYLEMSTIYLQHSGHIQIFHQDGIRQRLARPKKFNLKKAEQDVITEVAAANPKVEFVARVLTGQGLVGNGCRSYPYSAIGLEPEKEKLIRLHPEVRKIVPELGGVLQGLPLWEKPQGTVSVAKGLAALLGKTNVSMPVSSAVGLPDCNSPQIDEMIASDSNVQLISRSFLGGISAIDADISSYYSTGLTIGDNVGVQLPLKSLQELLETDTVSFASIFLKDKRDTQNVMNDLRKEFAKRGLSVDMYAWNDPRLNPNYTQGYSVLVVTVGFVAIIVGTVVLLSILNALTIALVEGRSEMGTLRSLGFELNTLASIHAAEILIVSLIGIALGALITLGTQSAIASAHIPFQLPGMSFSMDFQLTPTWEFYFLAAFSILALCISATIVTVRSYAKQTIPALLDRGG